MKENDTGNALKEITGEKMLITQRHNSTLQEGDSS
jgi:hypothetical protein